MNDELFTVPPTGPDPLVAARKRFEEADKALALANDYEDEFGDPVPAEVQREYRAAQAHLHRAEEAELHRQQHRNGTPDHH